MTRRDPLAARTAQPVALASDEGAQSLIQLAYDYSQVDEAHREQVKGAAVDIKRRTRRAQEDLIVAGQRLNEVKDMLPHGEWENWLNSEFEMSVRTAQNMMNVAERFAGKNETVSFLNGSVLYMLAAPSVPDEAVEQVVAEAQATGASPTKARAQAIIAKHKPAPAPPPAAPAVVGKCRVCGRPLTDPASVGDACGPTCAARLAAQSARDEARGGPSVCPHDLADAGWALCETKRANAAPGWYMMNVKTHAATAIFDDPEYAIGEAYVKQKGFENAAPPAASQAQQARQLRVRGELERWREVLRHVDTIGELTGRFTLAPPLRRAVEDVVRAYEENVAE